MHLLAHEENQNVGSF